MKGAAIEETRRARGNSARLHRRYSPRHPGREEHQLHYLRRRDPAASDARTYSIPKGQNLEITEEDGCIKARLCLPHILRNANFIADAYRRQRSSRARTLAGYAGNSSKRESCRRGKFCSDGGVVVRGLAPELGLHGRADAKGRRLLSLIETSTASSHHLRYGLRRVRCKSL